MKAVLSSLVVQETGSRGCCTFPSPSASVDLVRFVRLSGGNGCGDCCTFPEPEVEGEIKVSLRVEESSSSRGKLRALGRRGRRRSTIYSGSFLRNVAMKQSSKDAAIHAHEGQPRRSPAGNESGSSISRRVHRSKLDKTSMLSGDGLGFAGGYGIIGFFRRGKNLGDE